MAVMFLLPVAALMTGQVFVNVTYPDFLLHFTPISVVLTLFAFFWRATGTFRPHDAKLFGWEGLAFIFLRWPWSLAGSLAALRDYISGSFVDFRITPKGRQQQRSLPLRVIAPYIALAGLCAAAMCAVDLEGDEVVAADANGPGGIDLRDRAAFELEGRIGRIVRVAIIGLALLVDALADMSGAEAGDSLDLPEQIVEHVAPVAEHGRGEGHICLDPLTK